VFVKHAAGYLKISANNKGPTKRGPQRPENVEQIAHFLACGATSWRATSYDIQKFTWYSTTFSGLGAL